MCITGLSVGHHNECDDVLALQDASAYIDLDTLLGFCCERRIFSYALWDADLIEHMLKRALALVSSQERVVVVGCACGLGGVHHPHSHIRKMASLFLPAHVDWIVFCIVGVL